MEVTIQRDDLLRELAVADGVVSSKPTIPVLGAVMVRANGHGLSFVATDTELAVSGPCPASIARPGSMLVPARKLFELARTMPDAPIQLTGDGKSIAVAAAGFKGKLQTFPVEDFPRVAAQDGATSIALPAAGLLELIERTRFACSMTDKRYYLGGALIEIDANEIRMVATDSHRLALASLPRQGQAAQAVVLPKKTLDALSKLLADVEGDVFYARTDQHIFFTIGDHELASRQIDGQFPAYGRVIPKQHTTAIELDRSALVDVLRRTLVVSNSSSRRARFVIAPGSMTVGAQSAEIGEGEEPIAIDYSGPSVEVMMNGDYVRDFLDACGTDKILMQMTDGRRPVEFVSMRDDLVYRYVVMPQV